MTKHFVKQVSGICFTYIGRHIEPTKEAVYAAIDEFDETNEDMDAYINLKEFEVVSLDKI